MEPGFSFDRLDMTRYMEIVLAYLAEHSRGNERILDIPAGCGVFGSTLEELGHQVVKADINGWPGSTRANMEAPLPWSNGEFDVVTCLEGIEHVVNSIGLMRELVRVTAPLGRIIISTPNIANLYSRFQFLFTGTFFQFGANNMRQSNGTLLDRGHISPYTPLHLIYFFGSMGCRLTEIRVDRSKRKVLIPLYLTMKPFSYLWTSRIVKGTPPGTYPGVSSLTKLLNGYKLMFGRSQILVFEKTAEAASA
ncbi:MULTISPECIES: methyltransferase domain-containing protein [unclassified Caballeronia]|uniref:class I SAM-dependent methyltransferase n=1 Tax=unclassified Caballeronia TaxID=2646786 RepID=UPI00285AE426|nr:MULTISPECIES: methyltransferase domain-containing protein [unclassified Caballeronia]MDR5773161.1 methyltransferase domain-containing protein [Caballeronia sp. LZ002]MDR5848595.1 methyltransferase domain-containing protein [Caballeronia sp. LZ003]